VQLLSVAVTDKAGTVSETARRGDPLTIQLKLLLRERVPGFDLALYLLDRHRVRVVDEAWSDTLRAEPPTVDPGDYEARVTLPPVLAAGEYVVGVWIGSTIGRAYNTFIDREVLTLEVGPRPDDRSEWTERRRVVHLTPEWSVTSRAVRSQVFRS
jgi:hypothetical protein